MGNAKKIKMSIDLSIKEQEVIMNKDNSMIAENLKSMRLNKGWSQEFVANQLQLSIRTISRAENGWGCSDRTLKLLANMYQVPVSRFYELKETGETRYLDIVPVNVIAGMMVNNKFFSDLEQEVIRRFIELSRKEAGMTREDVNYVVKEALPDKKNYTFDDIVTACLVTNQKTLMKIGRMNMVS